MNETFWDAQNFKIQACANSKDFSGSGKIFRPGIFFVDWMLWVRHRGLRTLEPAAQTLEPGPLTLELGPRALDSGPRAPDPGTGTPGPELRV